MSMVRFSLCIGQGSFQTLAKLNIPSEEFELTANSLGTHIETHGKLILRILDYLTVNSQDDSHCELAVSFL